MKPVTVIIPTANRPAYLKTALASIAAQTGVEEIEEIIVSENLGNIQSGKVCKEFGKLPIRYIFRDPPLEPMKHLLALFIEPKTEYAAILLDDDWWLPGHLQRALTLLKERPGAVSFFSASIAAESEMYYKSHVNARPYLWVASGKPDFTLPYVLKAKDVMSIAWVVTPFTYSGMIVKSKTLVQSLPALEMRVVGSSDRLLYASVSTFGDIIYDPFPGIICRFHAGQFDLNISKTSYLSDLFNSSDIIYKLAISLGFDPAHEWTNYIKEIPVGFLDLFYNWLILYNTYPMKKKSGLDRIIKMIGDRTRNIRMKRAVMKCIPPMLFSIQVRLTRLFQKKMW